jgi:hypothetical protein
MYAPQTIYGVTFKENKVTNCKGSIDIKGGKAVDSEITMV